MSKWTDIRDSIVAEAKAAKIDEELKQSVTEKLYSIVLPALRDAGDGFTEAVREQSKGETGWVKIRDAIVLPGCIQAGLWAIEKLLAFIIDKTTTSESTAANA